MRKKLLFLLITASAFLLTACNTLKSSSDDAAKKNAKIASINIQLGMAYLEQGDVQRAKQKLLYALQKDPTQPEAWYSMGYFYEATGNKQEANIHYLKSVQLAPTRGDVQNNYGTYLCRAGDYRASIEHFLMATKDPQYLDTAGAYENAGLCALKIPDKQLAIKYFNLALEQDPARTLSSTELTKLKG